MDILYTVDSEIHLKWRYSNKVNKVIPQEVRIQLCRGGFSPKQHMNGTYQFYMFICLCTELLLKNLLTNGLATMKNCKTGNESKNVIGENKAERTVNKRRHFEKKQKTNSLVTEIIRLLKTISLFGNTNYLVAERVFFSLKFSFLFEVSKILLDFFGTNLISYI